MAADSVRSVPWMCEGKDFCLMLITLLSVYAAIIPFYKGNTEGQGQKTCLGPPIL